MGGRGQIKGKEGTLRSGIKAVAMKKCVSSSYSLTDATTPDNMMGLRTFVSVSSLILCCL